MFEKFWETFWKISSNLWKALNMTPRLSGYFSIFGLVFFVLKTMPGVVKNLQFCPQSLRVRIEF